MIFFTGNTLNRVGPHRSNRSFLSELLTSPMSSFMVLQKTKPLVEKLAAKPEDAELGGPRSRLVWLPYDDLVLFLGNPFELAPSAEEDLPLVLLGVQEELEDGERVIKAARWAVDATGLAEKDERFSEFCQELASPEKNREFAAPRPGVFYFSPQEASLYAQAVSLVEWNASNKHCCACGNLTASDEAGYKRHCLSKFAKEKSNCPTLQGIRNVSYPRTDPVTIVCVVSMDGGNCLLGRKKDWPVGVWSCLAGFLEPGESIEEAVIRETKEESGVPVDNVKYFASQPWPFPNSLMIGCFATALSNEIFKEDQELEDARWFSRDAVMKALKTAELASRTGKVYSGNEVTIKLPPPTAIAHQLLLAWVNGAYEHQGGAPTDGDFGEEIVVARGGGEPEIEEQVILEEVLVDDEGNVISDKKWIEGRENEIIDESELSTEGVLEETVDELEMDAQGNILAARTYEDGKLTMHITQSELAGHANADVVEDNRKTGPKLLPGEPGYVTPAKKPVAATATITTTAVPPKKTTKVTTSSSAVPSAGRITTKVKKIIGPGGVTVITEEVDEHGKVLSHKEEFTGTGAKVTSAQTKPAAAPQKKTLTTRTKIVTVNGRKKKIVEKIDEDGVVKVHEEDFVDEAPKQKSHFGFSGFGKDIFSDLESEFTKFRGVGEEGTTSSSSGSEIKTTTSKTTNPDGTTVVTVKKYKDGKLIEEHVSDERPSTGDKRMSVPGSYKSSSSKM